MAWWFAACLPLPALAASFIDDAGRHVELPAAARRVITLAPHLTELVDAVGGAAALVGADSASDAPAGARALARVGDATRLDVERILGLKPDLLIAWHRGATGREIAQVEAAGVRVAYLDPRRLDDVPRALERVGAWLGRAAAGRQRAQALRDELAALRALHAHAATVRVFYQVWSAPLMTINREHLVSDVVELCGGRNVFADLAQLVPQLSAESVVAADPELILAARERAGEPDAPADGLRRAPNDAAFATWRRHTQLSAVRRGWLFTLDGDTISRQGPRIVHGVRAVCAALDTVRRERAVLR